MVPDTTGSMCSSDGQGQEAGDDTKLPSVKPFWRLSLCSLSDQICESLSSLLSSQSCRLRVLDLSNNNLQDSGVEQLCVGLKSPQCILENLSLSLCHLSEGSCRAICSVLTSNASYLRVLDLSNNDLQDSGVKLLCEGLGGPTCRLQSLSLSGCLITEEGCAALASALNSNPSYLKHLDLSYNHPGENGLKLLSARLDNPNWGLKTLRVEPAGARWLKPGLRKYSCELIIDTNALSSNLKLSEDNRKLTRVEEEPYLDWEDSCWLLCSNGLTGRCYWEVEWRGEIQVLVRRRKEVEGTERDKPFESIDLGWSLDCSDTGFSFGIDNSLSGRVSFSNHPVCHKVAVYLDCPAGTLSFFSVDSDVLSHIQTFSTTFTDPVYVGFQFFTAGCPYSSKPSMVSIDTIVIGR